MRFDGCGVPPKAQPVLGMSQQNDELCSWGYSGMKRIRLDSNTSAFPVSIQA